MKTKTITNEEINVTMADIPFEMTIGEIIAHINQGAGAELGLVNDMQLQVARVDVVNSAGQFHEQDVMIKTNAHMMQPLEGHNTLHAESMLQQKAYRLYWLLDETTSIAQVRDIEEDLAVLVLDRFPLIDIHAGKVESVSNDYTIKHNGFGDILQNDVELLNVEEFEFRARQEQDLEDLLKITQSESQEMKVSAEELIDMAEYLANKDIEADDEKAFQSMLIGIWNSQQKGDYSEETALKIISTLDKNKHDEAYYKSFKIDIDNDYTGKIVTIASFIWLAENNGYKRSYMNRFYIEDDKQEDIKKEIINIKQFIDTDTEDMYEIFNNEYKNVLIDSATGSGKTTAAVEAAIKWQREEGETRYVYIAMPTQALTLQTSSTKELGDAYMGRKLIKEVLKENEINGKENIVVGTYDKSRLFMKNIESNTDAEVLVIADEVHKEVSDYFFRRAAIKDLFSLREHEQVTKFVGLSGTTQEVDKNLYDYMVEFKQEDVKPIMNNLKFLTYDKMKDYKNVTTKTIIKEIKEGRKVLAYINNKDTIEEMRKTIKKQGYKVLTITSETTDTEQVAAYEYMMKEEVFPSEYDAVLATNKIADGINIENDSEDYSVVMAPIRQTSPIFNLSLIKQMSNRFRNQYENFIVPIFITKSADKERLSHTKPFGLERRYNVLLEDAYNVAEYLRDKFEDRFTEYKPSIFEKMHGFEHINSHYNEDFERFGSKKRNKEYFEEALRLIRYEKANPRLVETLPKLKFEMLQEIWHIQDHLFTPDKRSLRKTASNDAENYYSFFPYAFVEGIENILDIKAEVTTVVEYLQKQNDVEMEAIENHFLALNALKEEEEEEKREKLGKVLTKEVYSQLRMEFFRNGSNILKDGELWKYLSELMSDIDLSILEENISYIHNNKDMINMMKSTNLKKQSEKRKFKRYMKALDDKEAFDTATERTKTNTIFVELKRALDNAEKLVDTKGVEFIANPAFDEVKRKLADKLKIKESEIASVFRRFFVFDKHRAKGTRGKANVRVIDLKTIANMYNIKHDNMKEIYLDFKKQAA